MRYVFGMLARFAFYLKHDGTVVMPFVEGPRQFEYSDAFSFVDIQGEKMFAIEIKNRRHGRDIRTMPVQCDWSLADMVKYFVELSDEDWAHLENTVPKVSQELLGMNPLLKGIDELDSRHDGYEFDVFAKRTTLVRIREDVSLKIDANTSAKFTMDDLIDSVRSPATA